MLDTMLMLAVAQASIITPPPADDQDRQMIERTRAMLLEAAKPLGRLERPLIVEAGEIQSASAVIRSERRIQEGASLKGDETAMAAVPTIVGAGCRRIADHPAGIELRDSSVLNGRSTLFDCEGMTLDIHGETLAHPLKAMTAVGVPPNAVATVVNGGALARNFRESRDGIRQVSYLWVGRSLAYTVTLTSDRVPFAAMAARADAAVEALTRP